MIRIRSGEYCDCICLEIEKVPDISILLDETNTNADTEQYIRRNKKGFETLLSELYQITKGQFSDDLLLQNNSYELLWVSEPISNQTYKARIRLFLIIRCIDQSMGTISSRLNNLERIFVSSLNTLRYTVKRTDEGFNFYSISSRLSKISIVKEDSIGNLQSYYMGQCYVYDKIPEATRDFGMLVDFLSHVPNACVSFQLIPTYYTYQEKSFLERTCSMLDTINKGIHDTMIGNVINSVAERYAEKYKFYEKNKQSALFAYNILLMADERDIMGLAAKVCGYIDGGNSVEDKISLRALRLSADDINIAESLLPMPWILNDVILDKVYSDYPIYYQESFDFRRLFNILTVNEASELFCLPVGTKYVANGLQIDYSEKDVKQFHKQIINSGDIEVGKLKSSFGENTIGFSLKDLNRHMLIVGVPGMGKTTYSVGLLDTLWQKFKLPFLVIEPAKSEYRAMLRVIPELQIFTFGKDDVSPMPLNPFVPPKGVKIRQYKSVLKTAFSAGVSMAESLSKLFEETLDEVYSEFGWLDSDTVESGGKVFNIRDFAKCFKKTFERHGYVGEAKNVGTAGLLRLVSMTNLFDNYYSVPVEDILSKPTVIELAAVQNKAEKSFLMALLLLSISAYIENNYLGDGTLRNIILIEEAHNLLAASDANEEGGARPNAIAQELVKNMLAEKRAQGLGIVIADQSPEKVGADVIKLTNIKLGFNLAEKTDKEIFANSTNMDEKQVERMTQLVEGEAYFFMGGMSKPEELAIPDYRADHQIAITINDADVKRLSTYWLGKEEKIKPFPDCYRNVFCGKSCRLREREIAGNVARKIFNKYFIESSKDERLLRQVLLDLVKDARIILGGKIELTKQLFYCIKIHLLRQVKYGTEITLTDELIKKAFFKAQKSQGGN